MLIKLLVNLKETQLLAKTFLVLVFGNGKTHDNYISCETSCHLNVCMFMVKCLAVINVMRRPQIINNGRSYHFCIAHIVYVGIGPSNAPSPLIP